MFVVGLASQVIDGRKVLFQQRFGVAHEGVGDAQVAPAAPSKRAKKTQGKRRDELFELDGRHADVGVLKR